MQVCVGSAAKPCLVVLDNRGQHVPHLQAPQVAQSKHAGVTAQQPNHARLPVLHRWQANPNPNPDMLQALTHTHQLLSLADPFAG
jgi:hypothetical protein